MLDSSSIPGFMTAMLGLIRKETIKRLNNIMDGESSATIENIDGTSAGKFRSIIDGRSDNLF
ncbi:hypothetical protein SCHPADRAFT_904181 [Schizopora paradoxa]|uniref:Uncharacterized protein n=1 Tax=Schizopora paradoxa TaxID=27342 RepID=A0A0H2RVM7_9AGAM|nr:hypothetical protein SCHPADRAFT_904181 [Schizopora paradoxa]